MGVHGWLRNMSSACWPGPGSDTDGTDREVCRMCSFEIGAGLPQRLDLGRTGTILVGRLQFAIQDPQLCIRIGGSEVANLPGVGGHRIGNRDRGAVPVWQAGIAT